MQFLVDIGNTRFKWARLVHGKLTHHGSAAHRGSLEHALAALSDALPVDVARVLVANVAGEEVARRLTELARAHSGVMPEFVATAAEAFGVRCAYSDPSRLGVDRWLGVLAAHRLAGGAACVIGAGTAVTFDAVDAHGQHLGGLIFAGARLAAAALDAHTSNIGGTAPAGARPAGLDLLGKSTDAAVGNGAMLALAAALDRAVGAVDAALGARSKVYLTGGDGPHFRGWLETDTEQRADLVLEGLALFAARRANAAERS
ncbi:MAG TPA: type III pantothenate kinase [Gammaproteobacteria bacterium]|nr:type III pantothenate kinase [Gammaproteobacteria bacterium]